MTYLAGMLTYGSVPLGLSLFHHNEPPWHANVFTAPTIRRTFARSELATRLDKLRFRSYGISEAH